MSINGNYYFFECVCLLFTNSASCLSFVPYRPRDLVSLALFHFSVICRLSTLITRYRGRAPFFFPSFCVFLFLSRFLPLCHPVFLFFCHCHRLLFWVRDQLNSGELFPLFTHKDVSLSLFFLNVLSWNKRREMLREKKRWMKKKKILKTGTRQLI